MNKEFTAAWDEPSPHQQMQASTAAPEPAGTAPVKQIVTIRLDVDTLAWFKSAGPGYQTRINQILREYMDAQRARSEAVD